MAGPADEFADIQGLVHSGYADLTQAAYLLLRVVDAAAARRWLADAPVTSAAERRATTVLQLAFTAEGLRALGLAPAVIDGFSGEFRVGMASDAARARRLGDVGRNDPAHWRWGVQPVPHALVVLISATDLAGWRARVATDAFRAGFEVLEELPTSDMGGLEPFGFMDGVSQPEIDWDERLQPIGANVATYRNRLAAGEFLLGYRNEYGDYTDRPLLDAGADPMGLLPAAAEEPALRDLGRNGTYLVLRELRQDVRGFWRCMASRGGAQPEALAESVVGRRRSGAPLIPGVTDNDFTYDGDPDGVGCPFGAHVRRANPRTADLPGGPHGFVSRMIRTLGFGRPDLEDDLIATSRFHRILRRGREFGSLLPRDAAAAPDAPDPQAGLQFICLNANLARQFEFIQTAWLMNAGFAGLDGEGDPLLGNRLAHPPGRATDRFGVPQPNGVTRRVDGMPAFVTPVGGAYFFLPGLRALRFIAAGK